MKKILFLLTFLSSNIYADIKINNDWVRDIPSVTKNTAAYMVIKNTGNQDLKITQVKSKQFMMAQTHKTFMQDGMMKMVHTKITIPAKGEVVLKPKSYHIMLMKKKSIIKKGQTIDIELTFSNGSVYKITPKVR